MNKKLTLLLDNTVIEQAKDYAKKNKETLSGIVEKYFQNKKFSCQQTYIV